MTENRCEVACAQYSCKFIGYNLHSTESVAKSSDIRVHDVIKLVFIPHIKLPVSNKS